MKCEAIQLKDHFPFLGENDRNPELKTFIQSNIGLPSGRKRPCMIICPGGAYSGCSPSEGEPLAMKLLTEGFNVFVLKYSVSPHRFPSQLLEVAATVELIYNNQEEWNCDTEKVLIMGSSAGGHLAAHYSTMYACDEVRKYFPNSKAVSGTVLNYPVITSNDLYTHKGSIINLTGKENLTENEHRFFSCELCVTENTPPAFIWHTAEDSVVPVMNSFLYAQALKDNNIPFELHVYPFGIHGLATCDSNTIANVTDKISHVTWFESLKKWLKIMKIYN